MGYMRHHAIIVTGYNREDVELAHEKASYTSPAFMVLISPIVESVTNGYYSFALFPDGSKEGREDSEQGDKSRDHFITWLLEKERDFKYDWVEVQYGDDNGQTLVIRDSDARNRE